ncbi:armadillo-type protein [Radiomyces spectabilis]|uniref:armadillo-type protein n=1 Tax=Radiomyces spectabilis TaxID=64574 RepID=UPI00221F95CF|nr:armadillo-type protein [Radiomyces spectabilis]KAI8391327.1 armadillo-type protein [Radiomyces spectabilis]
MPRTVRKARPNKKRGKRQTKEEETPENGGESGFFMDPQGQAPSEDQPMENASSSHMYQEQHFQAASFGEIDEQMLGYFKNVEKMLDDPQFETAEDQRLFVDSVYCEVEGNELRLTTNYSCSLILEKLLKISNAFQLRVFMDKLSGRSVELFAHRFASHVCQTLITLAADVVEREVIEGKPAEGPEPQDESQGVLLSMEELVLGMCEDIKPVVGGLISQQFASHVIRYLLFLLAGKRVDEMGDRKGRLRSKKSAKYKTENNDTLTKASAHASSTRSVPASFKNMFRTLSTELAINSSETEVRTLSVHQVANPVLQLLLEMQEDDEEGQKAKTVLLDRILWGIVTDVDSTAESKDRDSWFETLIRDSVGSHLLEVIAKVAPTPVYNKIYTTYLRNKLEKFSLHPIANFVIQHLLTNARSPQQFDMMVQELSGSFEKLIKGGKYGVIRSLIEASVTLKTSEKEILRSLTDALHMPENQDRKEFVNCVMRMWNLEDWTNSPEEDKRNLRNFHLQGSLILQAIVKMPAEHNNLVISSFLSQNPDTTFRWCFSPVGSRAYQSILSSPEVNIKIKRKVLRNLEGRYVDLAKDKFGSHIVEQCWSVADIDMKERIANELLKRERELSEHYIGKCILWTCKIGQFKRKREDWVEREKGIERKKEMFKDILEDEPVKASKKRKNF